MHGDKGHKVILTLPPLTDKIMTKKQIRDLQQFAVELAKEGNTAAAKEVLILINKAG